MTNEPSTRERIVMAARRLFAERGYRGTSVGDIEAAAGLSPRSGGLYKHFASKEAVLSAVFAEHTAAVDAMDSRLEVMPLGDLRAELTLIGRWGLAELRREHELTRIVMKEGDRFPEVARTFREAIVVRGQRLAADWVARNAERAAVEIEDPEAVAAVFAEALVGYTLQEVLFGPAATGIDDERFLGAWVDNALTVMQTLIEERSPAHA